MYLTLAITDKHVALARCQTVTAKAAATEAHATIDEKNALHLKTNRFEKELKEAKRKLGVTEEALAKARQINCSSIISSSTWFLYSSEALYYSTASV